MCTHVSKYKNYIKKKGRQFYHHCESLSFIPLAHDFLEIHTVFSTAAWSYGSMPRVDIYRTETRHVNATQDYSRSQ
jgi:hypothetical protein